MITRGNVELASIMKHDRGLKADGATQTRMTILYFAIQSIRMLRLRHQNENVLCTWET